MSAVHLIVGLGNPGPEYDRTRHNAGAFFVEQLADKYKASLVVERKFYGMTGKVSIQGKDIRLLIPTTYMNLSGQSVAAIANFYQIPIDTILIAHDELDLPPGVAKLKQGGSHGGHNGLRDIISKCANQNNFFRLRLGIGHPGNRNLVTNFVLGRAPKLEQDKLNTAIEFALDIIPDIANADWNKAMQTLHSQKA